MLLYGCNKNLVEAPRSSFLANCENPLYPPLYPPTEVLRGTEFANERIRIDSILFPEDFFAGDVIWGWSRNTGFLAILASRDSGCTGRRISEGDEVFVDIYMPVRIQTSDTGLPIRLGGRKVYIEIEGRVIVPVKYPIYRSPCLCSDGQSVRLIE